MPGVSEARIPASGRPQVVAWPSEQSAKRHRSLCHFYYGRRSQNSLTLYPHFRARPWHPALQFHRSMASMVPYRTAGFQGPIDAPQGMGEIVISLD